MKKHTPRLTEAELLNRINTQIEELENINWSTLTINDVAPTNRKLIGSVGKGEKRNIPELQDAAKRGNITLKKYSQMAKLKRKKDYDNLSIGERELIKQIKETTKHLGVSEWSHPRNDTKRPIARKLDDLIKQADNLHSYHIKEAITSAEHSLELFGRYNKLSAKPKRQKLTPQERTNMKKLATEMDEQTATQAKNKRSATKKRTTHKSTMPKVAQKQGTGYPGIDSAMKRGKSL